MGEGSAIVRMPKRGSWTVHQLAQLSQIPVADAARIVRDQVDRGTIVAVEVGDGACHWTEFRVPLAVELAL